MPLSPLHWIISDQQESITMESVKDGLKIYDNPVGVLTNNPPFDYHMYHLVNYMNLSPELAQNHFSDKIDLKPYCVGLSAMGMPGDLSSDSRFVRVAFAKLNSVAGATEEEDVGQFFHILGSVEQQKGCNRADDTHFEHTSYSSCCNMDRGLYYYITYENRQITCVDLHKEDLNGKEPVSYPLGRNQKILYQN